MEENTQLPKEVVEEIKQKAEDFANSHINGRTQPDVWEIVFKANEAGATAYATKWFSCFEENGKLATTIADNIDKIKVLEYDNNKLKGEVEGYKEAHEDHQRLVRHLDILINGDAAAEQASLCDLVNQIESFGLPAVKNPNYKAGALWVKCWEQKPDTHKVRFKDKHGNEFIGNYSKDTGQYWAYGLGQAINDVIYWQPQDESAAGREEAVEFAEWLLEYGYEPSFEKKWVDYSKTGDNRVSSAQLYELFKQQKEK